MQRASIGVAIADVQKLDVHFQLNTVAHFNLYIKVKKQLVDVDPDTPMLWVSN
jgi:hypothetical protein